MKKTELKNGAVVETKNGRRYLKVDNTLLNIADFGEGNGVNHLSLCSYTDDLQYPSDVFNNSEWDIVKVNNNVTDAFGYSSNAINEVIIENEWTWKRPATILDDVEKEYLSTICKPFKIINITKKRKGDKEYIKIRIHSKCGVDIIYLPYFEPNTMYKGMKLDREYTPEELGIKGE